MGEVKNRFGDHFQAITPGIRPYDKRVSDEDQSRVVTPAMAIERGSDHLVIGRPIRDASDPQSAARALAKEIQRTLDKE